MVLVRAKRSVNGGSTVSTFLLEDGLTVSTSLLDDSLFSFSSLSEKEEVISSIIGSTNFPDCK